MYLCILTRVVSMQEKHCYTVIYRNLVNPQENKKCACCLSFSTNAT